MRKGLLIGAVLGVSTATFATNGDNLIGLTPASRAMGGIGVGLPVGPVDSIFRNPAWMGLMENKFMVQFGGIIFMPKVKGRIQNPLGDSGFQKSGADLFLVPEIGIVYKVSDRITFGLGAFGVSGMGVDYRNNPYLRAASDPLDPTNFAPLNMHTTFQFMRIIPSIAFKVNEMITVALAPHLAWGSLDMGATFCADAGDPATCWNAGGGQSQDIGLGFQVGAGFNFGDFLFAGITYQSPVSMKYKKVFDTDGDRFFEDLKLTQPQEFAIGVGAAPLNNLRVGIDLRWIDWSGADGYKHFQWKDQWVFSIGGEFKPMDKLALRAGWNYGRTPIRGKSGLQGYPVSANNIPNFAAPFGDFNIAFFNLIGFPAIAEHHITLGLGYEFTKTFSVDLSYVRALSKRVTSSGTYYDMGACSGGCPTTVSAKMFQDSISVGLNWRF